MKMTTLGEIGIGIGVLVDVTMAGAAGAVSEGATMIETDHENLEAPGVGMETGTEAETTVWMMTNIEIVAMNDGVPHDHRHRVETLIVMRGKGESDGIQGSGPPTKIKVDGKGEEWTNLVIYMNL